MTILGLEENKCDAPARRLLSPFLAKTCEGATIKRLHALLFQNVDGLDANAVKPPITHLIGR